MLSSLLCGILELPQTGDFSPTHAPASSGRTCDASRSGACNDAATWAEKLPPHVARRWRGHPKAQMRELLIATEYWLALYAKPLEEDGIAGLLSLSEAVWEEIEMNPENEEKWLEVSVMADIAANYSTIYDVWCKDMINHRMKMRKMSEKKKGKKEKEDN